MQQSLQLALERVNRAQTRKGREALGLCAVEGLELLRRACAAGHQVHEVVMSVEVAACAEVAPLLARLAEGSTRLYTAPARVLETLAGGRNSGQIQALVALPEARDVQTLTGVVLAALDVAEPGNVGALCRTAAAGGARALLVSGVSDPFHPKALRTSRGAAFQLPVARVDGPAQLGPDRAGRMRLMAAVAHSGRALTAFDGVALDAAALTLLMFGNEARGIPRAWLSVADACWTIPMAPGIDSYSVNAAAAILLYEFTRHLRTCDHQTRTPHPGKPCARRSAEE